ncbi:MAG: hypothetical protein AAB875_04880 [Patescibacteria group bacterium]
MSIELWFFLFVVWRLLHAIGDFGTARRRWRGEFWIVADPLHWLWDVSPFRTHHKSLHFFPGDEQHMVAVSSQIIPSLNEKPLFPTRHYFVPIQVIVGSFWKRLAVDQAAHVVLNLIWTGFLTVVIEWAF